MRHFMVCKSTCIIYMVTVGIARPVNVRRKAKIYGVLYNQASSIAFDDLRSDSVIKLVS